MDTYLLIWLCMNKVMMMFIRYHMILGLASSYPIWYFLENDVHNTQISMFADIIEQ